MCFPETFWVRDKKDPVKVKIRLQLRPARFSSAHFSFSRTAWRRRGEPASPVSQYLILCSYPKPHPSRHCSAWIYSLSVRAVRHYAYPGCAWLSMHHFLFSPSTQNLSVHVDAEEGVHIFLSICFFRRTHGPLCAMHVHCIHWHAHPHDSKWNIWPLTSDAPFKDIKLTTPTAKSCSNWPISSHGDTGPWHSPSSNPDTRTKTSSLK